MRAPDQTGVRPAGEPPRPPVHAGSEPAPIWPTVLGVLSIVLGVETIVSGAGWLEARIILNAVGLGDGAPTVGGLRAAILLGMRAWQVLDAILLIVAGALLARRRPAGGALHVIYAVARIAELLALPFARWMGYSDVWVSDYRIYMTAQAVGGTLIGLAFPIFLLVWFRRPDIRRHLAAYRRVEARQFWRPTPGSAWPAALGVVALVGAAAAVLTTVVTVGIHVAMRHVIELGGSWEFPGPLVWLWHLWRNLGLSLLAGTGGLWLLHRRRAGGALLMVYACLAALTTAASPAVEPILYEYPKLYFSWRFLLMRIPYLLIGLVWPVFLMVWLLRGRVRQQMRDWAPRRP